MSGPSAHASTQRAKRASSGGAPNVMLSFRVAFWHQACCGQKAVAPATFTEPRRQRISPRSAAKSEDLPAPVTPATSTSSPRRNLTSTRASVRPRALGSAASGASSRSGFRSSTSPVSEKRCARSVGPAAPAAAPAAAVNTAGIAVRDYGAIVPKRNAGQKYAAISGFLGVVPELPRPEILDGTHAGDYGFDPAGFVTTPEELYTQMEAEVRHCRLAMLCAAGWPLSEIKGADFFDGYFLADGGRAPSVLNGGLFDTFPPLPLMAVAGFFAFVGVRELQTLNRLKCNTLYGHVHSADHEAIQDEWPWGVAGDDDFDPLGLYGLVGNDAVGRHVMREMELNHGRVAMLAVLAYVVIEAVTGIPVVSFMGPAVGLGAVGAAGLAATKVMDMQEE
mmetsp:Transcript_20847/g.62203  ORF Transcript_20847/g.62203 Transcript_20847/m.62203 type:complete len:392 (+) Transcript_20847:2386-3561(+)